MIRALAGLAMIGAAVAGSRRVGSARRDIVTEYFAVGNEVDEDIFERVVSFLNTMPGKDAHAYMDAAWADLPKKTDAARRRYEYIKHRWGR